MKTFIALLRGINVAGQKKIKMAELREILSQSGLSQVQTYIQSGNIVFQSKMDLIPDLENLIRKSIKDHYDFDVPTIVLTLDYLKEADQSNPYVKEAQEKGSMTFITFLAQQPTEENIAILKSKNYAPDIWELKSKNLYLYCPNGAGNSKISNNLFENKLKVSATTRNFKTVWKLIEMASQT